ncbi:hypothetical protein LTR66_010921 [Elasticomyces elasticus]|nr:hypothetical protein LTR66_010921 [Elasticomyces elasticus]
MELSSSSSPSVITKKQPFASVSAMPERISNAIKGPEVVRAEDGAVASMGDRMADFSWDRRDSHIDFQGLIDEAKGATEAELNMTVWEAIKLYPKATAWSVLASTALIMEGYDLVVINSFYAFPAFTEKYGVRLPDGSYSITAPWQSGLSEGAVVGEMLGLMLTGIVCDRYGYRKTITAALIMVVCFIFVTFFSINIKMLLAGEILCGIPWGVFQTITTAYAAEVSPIALRPLLTTYVNLCWVMGQFIGSGVLRSLVNRTDQWAYKIPFAIQWMWPIPLFVGMVFAPESPWWLVRKGRLNEAERSLRRLTTKGDTSFDPQKTIAMMIHTNELEKQASAGTSYWDCFRGSDLRRTEIACMAWGIQTLAGSGIMGGASQFFVQAGLEADKAFDLTMGQYALGAFGTVSAWALMLRFGRRTLYLVGLAAMFVALMLMGVLSIPGPDNANAVWASGAMVLIYTFLYDVTVGPVCYCLVAEISSTRLRGKTIVLARNFYNITQIFNFVLTPRMLNPTAWAWRGKAGFFWAGACALCFLWSYFRLPEPKGKTYAELDVLFKRGVPAGKFACTKADPFRGDTIEARQGSIVKVMSRDSEYNQSIVYAIEKT